jgi:uncharacterized protein
VGEDDSEIDAGSYSSWHRATLDALASGNGIDVPCGACTACCRSSYFIHVTPDETETLRRIPRVLRVPAPGLPAGHVVLGYDERGHCPMLVDDRCSIYEHRPRTCRQYDCRVFAAAGVDPVEDGKVRVAVRVRQWRFAHASAADRAGHDATVAASAYLRARPDAIPVGEEPRTAADLAVLGMRASVAFVDGREPPVDQVRAALER